MKTVQCLSALVLTVVMSVACGTRDDEITGGGAAIIDANGDNLNESSEPGFGAALPDLVNVQVISDVDSILTGSTETALITAFVTNDSNAPAAPTSVDFASDGGLLQNLSFETDIDGQASGTLALTRDFRNQDITVEVNVNGAIDTAVVRATGTEIVIDGSLNLSIGSDATLTARLTSGAGAPIPNEAISVTSSQGHEIFIDTEETDVDGVFEFDVLSLSESDTIMVSALDATATASAELNVVTDFIELSGLAPLQEIPVGDINDVTVTWTSSGVPVAGESVRASLTAGQLLSANEVRTNGDGQARFTVVSSNAGPSTLTVGAVDGSIETDIDVEFIATVPATLNLDSSSSRISTLDTSSISATVIDANGNPVKNQEISFASSNLFGGQLSPASAITNSDGEAVTIFTAGSSATEFEELNVSAQIVGTGVADTTRLTVVERVLNLTIGTSNEIFERALDTQFAMPFVVQVADGGGAPLEGATVTLSVRPLSYRKGFLQLVDENGFAESVGVVGFDADRWSANFISCESEDSNGNRILDPGEDENNNGALDPQDPSLLAPVDDASGFATLEGGSLVTDARGTGLFELLYPASSATWARVEITARAQALGAETEATFQSSLPMLAADRIDTGTEPPNIRSPYGIDLDCSNDL